MLNINHFYNYVTDTVSSSIYNSKETSLKKKPKHVCIAKFHNKA